MSVVGVRIKLIVSVAVRVSIGVMVWVCARRKIVLEQSCELTVSIWYVTRLRPLLFVSKGGNNITSYTMRSQGRLYLYTMRSQGRRYLIYHMQ